MSFPKSQHREVEQVQEEEFGMTLQVKWSGKTGSTGAAWTVHVGDALAVLKSLPALYFDCVVTSPPYYWLRDYGVEGQIGHEETAIGYVNALADVMDEVRRVLKDRGLVFLNIGDTYYSGKGKSHGIDPKSTKRRFGLRAVKTRLSAEDSKSPGPKLDRELLHQLMKRGISEKASISLLRDLRPDQQVMDQLEWGDHLVFHSPNKHKFYNPAGLYIHLIKENATPPETFETSRKRSLREAARQAREKEQQEFAALQLAYMQYQKQQLDRFVEANADEYSTLVEAKKNKLAQQDHWKRIFAGKQDILQRAAERQVRTDLLGRVGMMNFDAFRQQRSREGEQQIVTSVNPGKSVATELSQMPAGHVPEGPNG